MCFDLMKNIFLKKQHGNEKNNENEIFLISLRIHYKWNIETLYKPEV